MKAAVLRRSSRSPKSLSLREVSFDHVSPVIASWSGSFRADVGMSLGLGLEDSDLCGQS